jgi:hypothetical protein
MTTTNASTRTHQFLGDNEQRVSKRTIDSWLASVADDWYGMTFFNVENCDENMRSSQQGMDIITL